MSPSESIMILKNQCMERAWVDEFTIYIVVNNNIKFYNSEVIFCFDSK